MIMLAHLRALHEGALIHAENPAIVRLTDRTVEGVATAYLPVCVQIAPPIHHSLPAYLVPAFQYIAGSVPLDLSDPGTAHALLVALALALGLDPGVGGLSCSWFRRNLGGYILLSDSTNWTFETAESDAIKALALAALHVLERP